MRPGCVGADGSDELAESPEFAYDKLWEFTTEGQVKWWHRAARTLPRRVSRRLLAQVRF